jgi:hypothetical protein
MNRTKQLFVDTGIQENDQAIFPHFSEFPLPSSAEGAEICESQRNTKFSSLYSQFTTSYLTKDAFNSVHRGPFFMIRDELCLGPKLGEGEFGIVLKGTHHGSACAAKMLKDGVTYGTMQHRRLLIELSILASVGEHQNLVKFLGACIDDLSAPIIVEEFIDGQDLETFLRSKPSSFNLGQPKV